MRTFVITLALCTFSFSLFAAHNATPQTVEAISISLPVNADNGQTTETSTEKISGTGADIASQEVAVRNRYDRLSELKNPLYASSLLA